MIIRRADAADAEAIAVLDHTARHTAMPTIKWPHDLDSVRRFVRERTLVLGEVWVAEEDGVILGYMDLRPGWVYQLYLAPTHWRRGIGSRFMAHAKNANPAGLQLYCFQVNARGRAFYESHGFRIAAMGDGSKNDEGEPDIRYAWQPDGAAP